ncbi:fimbrial chaperone protein [Serratia sp. PL17]|uniref:fimbrial biogenesis chaperone n=1 Tax=Serratia sp. PL17 TaxID=2806582 RepID=UPI001AE36535|nr:molecular chaperone [Serratia sp. PL17]MBP1133081.1 fimbrial chaperone protein [Serratia sp. PL17]
MKLTLLFRRLTAFCCLGLMAGIPSCALASTENTGITFYVLRVIYPATEKKGVTMKIYNKTTTPYLMQSLIRPVDPVTGEVSMDVAEGAQMPFIVTPPLSRMEPGGELGLRIRRNDVVLPTDRESVFFLSMKGIPAQIAPEQRVQNETTSQVTLAVVNSLKVFYRPEGLAKRAVADVAGKLRFRLNGTHLTAENPTPYWLTFSRLKVGGTALDNTQLRQMVPPKGLRHYTVPEGVSGAIEWQLIDEDGWDTPVKRQN